MNLDDRLRNREFVKQELAKAEAILRSHEATQRKLAELAVIEQALIEGGLPHAAAIVRGKASA